MTQNLILIQTDTSLGQSAILKDGRLSEFFVEDLHKPSQVGAIYKARVVQKGLGSFFVDLGQGQSAFLSIPTPRQPYKVISDKEIKDQTKQKKSQKKPAIIKRGQYVMVQIIKDAFKNKNLRVSPKISLPGAHLVYLPQDASHIGISRQIEDPAIREKLIQHIQKWKEPGGLIIRTKAGFAMQEETKVQTGSTIRLSSLTSVKSLKKEAKKLKKLYLNILKKYRSKRGPGLVYSPPSFAARLVRDFLTEDIQQILVNDKHIHMEVKKFLNTYIPEENHKLNLYQSKPLSLFDKYNLKLELKNLTEKKVKLPSGGFIILEETEAAVVVDVNSGNFRGRQSQDENILKVNLSAAEEITRQLRLRNCGGIVLIDFIDMEKEENRQKLMEELELLLKKDRAPTNLFPLSEISIAQITRKRERPSLKDILLNPCPHCDGLGHTLKPYKQSP